MPISKTNVPPVETAMKGYLLAYIKPTSAKFQEYPPLAAPSVRAFGGKLLSKQAMKDAIYKEQDAEDLGSMVVLQFPSLQTALDWYNSDEYADAKKLRLETSTGPWTILEGPDFGDEEYKGYLGAFIKVNDKEAFSNYAPVESLSKYTSPDKRAFVKMENAALTETHDYDAAVLIAFPSGEKGKEWMQSTEYKPQLELRLASTSGPCAIIAS